MGWVLIGAFCLAFGANFILKFYLIVEFLHKKILGKKKRRKAKIKN
jgi:hypothetical protein